MGVTMITHLHAAPERGDELAGLLATGRDRMRTAEGCESFQLLRDEGDARSFVFLQRWSSHEAHDAAFVERIVQTGHLDKVLAAIDEEIVQPSYQVSS
jgi:quinol monooxygenase YgiN